MQGFNMGRYVPPDQEGLVSGNRLLGNRAQKATAAGVPIVRFEMPFAVWCDGCEARTIGRDGTTRHPVLIGQGVRFNAEKHRTGNYHSTPIWTFRMRHPACGTWLAIRTDPATTSYIVAEGGRRRREYSDEEGGELDPAAAAAASAAALTGGEVGGDGDGDNGTDRLNAFDRLERTIVHRAAATAISTTTTSTSSPGVDAARHLDALTRSSARQWDDPYARNRALRAAFRSGRHAREQAAADDEGLRQRLGGLSEELRLLPATEEDARYAALVDFGSKGGGGEAGGETPSGIADWRILAKPLFGSGTGGGRGSGGGSGSTAAARDTKPQDRSQNRDRAIGSKSASLPALPISSSSSLSPPSRNRAYAPTTEAAKRQRSIRDHLASTVLANTRLTTDPFVMALGGASGNSSGHGNGDAAGKPGAATAARTKVPIKGLKRSATAAEIGQRTGTVDNTDGPSPLPDPKRKRDVDADNEEEDAASSKIIVGALVSYDSD